MLIWNTLQKVFLEMIIRPHSLFAGTKPTARKINCIFRTIPFTWKISNIQGQTDNLEFSMKPTMIFSNIEFRIKFVECWFFQNSKQSWNEIINFPLTKIKFKAFNCQFFYFIPFLPKLGDKISPEIFSINFCATFSMSLYSNVNLLGFFSIGGWFIEWTIIWIGCSNHIALTESYWINIVLR